jgi:hypothetical protein
LNCFFSCRAVTHAEIVPAKKFVFCAGAHRFGFSGKPAVACRGIPPVRGAAAVDRPHSGEHAANSHFYGFDGLKEVFYG